MMKLFALALVVAGCTKAPPAGDSPRNRTGVAAPAAATVTLTSVRFADDCGGTPPWDAPAVTASAVPAKASVAPASPAVMAPAEEEHAAPGRVAARRRCEQTSMQLSVTAAQDTIVRVKSVEVFDEKGASLGVIAASKPTRWSDANAAYEAWNEQVAAGQTALVSYVLQQPSFVSQYDERDRTYTVKVVASVGGVDQPLQTSVMVVGRPAAVPT